MIPVSTATKEAFTTSSTTKYLKITFPDLGYVVPMTQIEQESMELSEKLMDRDVEFVGCYASMFSISLRDVPYNLKNQKIVVTIKALDTQEIPLFKGIVDSVSMKASKSIKTITAYDALYTKGQIDIASWYMSLSFPLTIKNFRDSLFEYIGLEQSARSLPNDNIFIDQEYEPKTLQCLPVLKYLCQINGCFGIINRQGIFEYKFMDTSPYEPIYPSVTLYPSSTTFPADPYVNFAYYKSIDYQEYLVNPVQRLQIRLNEDEAGVTVGNSSGNKYIIQNNMFAYGQDAETLTTMATNIWQKISNVTFHPCDTDNTGLPYVEVGDMVSYVVPTRNRTRSSGNSGYSVNNFAVMSRNLHGVQGLMDNYGAEGEQDQSEFITDIQTQIDTIKRSGGGGNMDPDDYYTKDETEEFVDYAIATETQQIVSVVAYPVDPDENTVYLIQGDLVMIY